MPPLTPPKVEAETLVNKLATSAPQKINTLEIISEFVNRDLETKEWRRGGHRILGAYFEHIIGRKLVESFTNFDFGPNYENGEVDFSGNYLWDFKSTKCRRPKNPPTSSYNMSLNHASTIQKALSDGGMGFIVLNYEALEKEKLNKPVVTNAIRRDRGEDTTDSVSKRRRAPLIASLTRIEAYWIDGPQKYHECCDESMWERSRPITPKEYATLHFSGAKRAGLKVAEAEI